MKKYYFGTVRKIVSGFGSMFADIHITKHYDDGESRDVRVPLNYGSRSAWYLKLKKRARDKEAAAKIATTLPRISFEMDDIAYANARAISKHHAVLHREKNVVVGKILRQYQPIPWDYEFTVSIATKSMEDGLRIIEQIVPYFRPDHTLTVDELPAVGMPMDVTVNMTGISKSDSFEGSLGDADEVMTWDLKFVVHGHIMPPLTDSALIAEVEAIARTKTDAPKHDVYTANKDADGWQNDVETAIKVK